MRLGADVDDLDRLATLLGRTAARLDDVIRFGAASSAALTWHGPDSRRWRDEWNAVASDAGRIVRSLLTAARAASVQAAGQRATSEPSGGLEPLGRAGLSASPGPSGSSARLASSGPGSAARGDAAPDAPVAALAHRRFAVAATASVAQFAGDVGTEFVVDDLPDGTSIVTERVGASAGVGVSADRRIGVGWAGATAEGGVGAAASVTAGLATVRTWTVPTSDVDDLIVARSLGAPVGGRSPAGAVAALVPGLDVVAGILGHADDVDRLTRRVPVPAWEGLQLRSRVDGSAGTGGSAGPAAGAAIGGVVAGEAGVVADVSVVRRRSDGAVALRLDALGSAATRASGGESSTRSATSAELVLDADGAPRSLRVLNSTDAPPAGAPPAGAPPAGVPSADDRVATPVPRRTEVLVEVDLTTSAMRTTVAEVGASGRRLADALGAALGDPLRIDDLADAADDVVGSLRGLIAEAVAGAVATESTYRVVSPGGGAVTTPFGGVEVVVEEQRRER